MKTVQVHLPGPRSDGDLWGEQWSEPGVTSPGPEWVAMELIEAHNDGTATIHAGEGSEDRTLPEGTGVYEYRRNNALTHDAVKQAKAIMAPLAAHPSPAVQQAFGIAENILSSTDLDATLLDLANSSVNPGRTDDQILAIIGYVIDLVGTHRD